MGRTPAGQPVGGHRLTGAEGQVQECVCVRAWWCGSRWAGRQIADRRWQMQLGVDWVQLAAGTRVPPPAHAPTNGLVLYVRCGHTRKEIFLKKHKKRNLRRKISGGGGDGWFAPLVSWVGSWTRSSVGPARGPGLWLSFRTAVTLGRCAGICFFV